MNATTRPSSKPPRQRIKVGLPADRALLLERKACAEGETVSAYVRRLIERDLAASKASLPALPTTVGRRARIARTLKVGLSAETDSRLIAKSAQARLTIAAYVRELIRHDLGELDSKPTVNRHHDSMMLASEVHTLAMQVKKLGTNFNQMARQVNKGIVPLSRREIEAMSRLYNLAMEKAEAIFEKVLAR